MVPSQPPSGDRAQHRGLAVAQPFHRHPGQCPGRGGQVGHQHRHGGAAVGGHRRARALKPNQPTHNIPAPATVRVRLCGGMATAPKPGAGRS